MGEWVIGIDLGASKIALGLINSHDRIVAQDRIPTDAPRGPQAAVERMVVSIAGLARQVPTDDRIAAVGICSPGPIDHNSGMIIDPPNLIGWRNVPLQQMLSQQLNLPVRLEHDAKAAALGEFHYGAGRAERSMVFVVVGTGVGAAIILDGELYRGPHNSAGEIGHVTIDRNGPLCSCGSRGCVETYTSGPWLGRYYKAALARAEPGQQGDEHPITGERVAELASQGDLLALRVLTDAGAALGASIATVAMIMDVDFFVIGGSVAKCGDLILKPIRQSVPSYAFGSVSSRVRVVATALADDGPILGCGWLARQTM